MDALNYWDELGFDVMWKERASSVSSAVILPVQELVSDQEEGVMSPSSPLMVQEVNLSELGWDELSLHAEACRACHLGCQRTQAVVGVGIRNAAWMVIGEAPGADEDRLGEPFVGQAGKLLDAMLLALDLSRSKNVYIANVLKCRPPNNRKPQADEVSACVGFLKRQLDLVQPKILLAVGATAAQALLNTDEPIGKLRGRVYEYEGHPLIVTYHPAYLLRAPTEKGKVWADLCLARRVFEEISR